MVSDALEGEIARVAALSFPDRGGVVPAAFDFGAAHDASPRQRVCGFRAGHDKSWPALTHTMYRLEPCQRLNPKPFRKIHCPAGTRDTKVAGTKSGTGHVRVVEFEFKSNFDVH